jgi:uncharacterized protein
MMIWDLHCHITSGLGGRTPDESMARLMTLADRMGIERLVIDMGDRAVADPSPDELRRQNDQVLQALSHWHHRAFGFVYVSPRHVEASLREKVSVLTAEQSEAIRQQNAHRLLEMPH